MLNIRELCEKYDSRLKDQSLSADEMKKVEESFITELFLGVINFPKSK